MSEKNGKASLASKPLDVEDTEALARVAGSANQGTESASPAAGGGQPSPAVNLSPGALMWAGHAVNLCNQFFVARFGAEGKIPDSVLDPIRNDLALAIDTYLPSIEAKPGVFALVALGGHFFACQRAHSEKPSASSDSPGPEKLRSSGSSSDAERES